MRYSQATLLGLSLGLLCLAVPRAGAGQGAKPLASGGKLEYVGTEICQGCHPDQYDRFLATSMGQLFLKTPRNEAEKLGCEGCHGPGSAHVDADGKKPGLLMSFAANDRRPATERNAVCMNCHDRGARMYWQGSPHEGRDLACTNCHTVMQQVSERALLSKPTVLATCGQCHQQRTAQLARFSHMPLGEGKLDCTSCHNPHGSQTEKLLKGNSMNEVCYACHAEKRGPFMYEHQPVEENCGNCHDPHGSNNEKMLTVSKPRLCQRCHDTSGHPARPLNVAAVPSSATFLLNRQCVNCHFNIHGSNHPSGSTFTR